MVKALEEKGYTFASAEVEMVPQNYIQLSGEGDVKNMEKLIDMLEDNDDVQNVWHNWDNDWERGAARAAFLFFAYNWTKSSLESSPNTAASKGDNSSNSRGSQPSKKGKVKSGLSKRAQPQHTKSDSKDKHWSKAELEV